MPEQPAAERVSTADGVRFAFGTLTVLPVRVARWDRPAGRAGMLYAPLAGLTIGLLAGAAGAAVRLLGGPAALAGVAAVAVPAVLTRGLHADGLADTADGLGSAKPAAEALRIMKQSDIGPFGVVTLVLVLLAQAAALAGQYADGWARGLLAAAVAGLVGRAAMTLACRVGVPAARADGLGAVVAGNVPAGAAWAVASAAVLAAAGAGAVFGPVGAARLGAGALLGVAAAVALLRHCVRRFGGVTGDVFGAVCETAVTTLVVVASLG